MYPGGLNQQSMPENGDDSPATLIWIGDGAAALSYLLSPILAPISLYCALRVRHHDHAAAIRIAGLTGGAILVWTVVLLIV